MRNFPTIMYLREHNVSKFWKESRDITLAVKVEIVEDTQYLVAAIAVTNPIEAFVTEEVLSHSGLDSFPSLVTPPKGKYPFVKAEGRARAIERLNKAILTLKDKKTSFRDKGVVAVANDHDGIVESRQYRLIEDCVYIKNGAFPLLDMSRPLLTDMAIDLFRNQYRSVKQEYIDLGFSFNSKEI